MKILKRLSQKNLGDMVSNEHLGKHVKPISGKLKVKMEKPEGKMCFIILVEILCKWLAKKEIDGASCIKVLTFVL